MVKLKNVLFLVLLLTVFGACERVKEKEAIADLPKTSVEDTLVLTPDTLEMDTVLTDTDADTNALVGTESYAEEESDDLDGTGASGPARTETSTATETRATNTSSKTEVASSGAAAAGASTSKAVITRKRYVRPTRQQLQRALAQDARRSNQMDLPRLKNYWLRRQHYYRRATKDIKYVAGDTKIKISTEETKIETPKGKVKIEGNDIKVKYD